MPINGFVYAYKRFGSCGSSEKSGKPIVFIPKTPYFFPSDTIKALIRAFIRPNLNQKYPETHSK